MSGFFVTKLLEWLRTRLWLAPAVTAVLAFAGEKALVAFDRSIDPQREAWFLFAGAAESARELLSTIASSMMTFIGLVFSITILVLQLASSQFSPRVLRTFLGDRGTQLAMGSFVGTFVFSMALLPDVRSPSELGPAFVPALSIYVAFALVLFSVGVFIHYIDHMAQAIRVTTIIKRVAAETHRVIRRMDPGGALEGSAEPVTPPGGPPSLIVHHEDRGGVLCGVDEDALMKLARETSTVVALVPMPGEFVPNGAPLVRIWGPTSGLDRGALRAALSLGDERTPYQDPAFGFRQLVDIAERALSPGINDPSTAVQALDEIHDLLRALALRQLPSQQRVDPEGALRLILPQPSWPAFVGLALDEIRHYGAGSIQVARRIRVLIEDCLSVAPPERRPCLEEQRRLLDEATRRELPPADRALTRRGPGAGPCGAPNPASPSPRPP